MNKDCIKLFNDFWMEKMFIKKQESSFFASSFNYQFCLQSKNDIMINSKIIKLLSLTK